MVGRLACDVWGIYARAMTDPQPSLETNAGDAQTTDTLANTLVHAAASDADPIRTFSSNTDTAFIMAGGTFLAIMALFWLMRTVLVSRLRKVADRTETRVDNLAVAMLQDVRLWTVLLVALAVAARALVLPGGVDRALNMLAVLAIALQVILSSRLLVEFAMSRVLERTKRPDGTPDPTVMSAAGIVRTLAVVVVGAAAMLFALQNLGVQVTPLLGALGIGGIAIALAAQGILGDLFASLMIVFDKPFQVGNFIVVGDKMGVVEKIGIKTTRIKSISGEQVVFCNSDLLSSRLHNFGVMAERRVVGSVSIIYETPPDKLRRVPEIIKGVIESTPNVRLDRCHFKSLGQYSLDFEFVYFVTAPDFLVHAAAQQSINFSLFETFQREGLEFAYPTSLQYARITRQGGGDVAESDRY